MNASDVAEFNEEVQVTTEVPKSAELQVNDPVSSPDNLNMP
jgi:hypothetical protein